VSQADGRDTQLPPPRLPAADRGPLPLVLILTVLGLLFLAPATLANPEHSLNDSAALEAFFDGMMLTQLREREIAGASLAVVRGGEVVLAKGYGLADVPLRRPVDPHDTLFRIASVTKLFTATAVMQLVEQGLLELATDVNEYLDFRIPDTFPEPITLTHLLTHTAGLEEDLRNIVTPDLERVVPLAAWVRANLPSRVRPPGTFAAYSNHGTALAGYIVERVAGTPWDEYLEARVLAPLAMERTTGRQPLPQALAPLASGGYAPKRGGFEARPWDHSTGGTPAGALTSTAADMARFMLAHLGAGALGPSRILKPETTRLMQARHFEHDPRLPGHALGFYEMSSHGERIIGHAGNTGSFHSLLFLFPERDLGVFVSYNTTTAAPLTFGPFLRTFLDRYFPQPPPRAAAAPRQMLAPLEGLYRVNRISHTTFQKIAGLPMTFALRERDGALVATSPLAIAGNVAVRLAEVEPLLFGAELGPARLAFRTDRDGRATHAFLSLAPMMALERVPWHGAPRLHAAILGGGLVVFLGILTGGGIGWWRRRARRRSEPRPRVVARRALVAAAAANVGFAAAVVLLAGADWWHFLTTPMTGFAVALALPVVGALATAISAVAIALLWKDGGATLATRLGYSGALLAAGLFAWSLHYWNLLGWRL
jgi:CubicO group peptidase (beta-lactamase class C family)